LFVDPEIPFPSAKAALRLFQKKMGFRMSMDLIPLDASLVKGTHGAIPKDKSDWPMLLGSIPEPQGEWISSTEVRDILLRFCTH